MILICPNCTTRYLVDPASIGEDGRQVRCANCFHEWFETAPEQEPLYQAPEPPPMPDIPDEPDLTSFESPAAEEEIPNFRYSSNLPTVVDAPKAPPALIAAFCILFLITWAIAGTAYHRSVMKYLPFTKNIYAVFGLYPAHGVTLTDVTIARQPSIKNPAYQIDCKLINTTSHELFVPGMRVSLLDKSGEIITQQNVSSNEGKRIGPGEKIACDQVKVELSKRSENAEKIRLDIGNAYDLFIRK